MSREKTMPARPRRRWGERHQVRELPARCTLALDAEGSVRGKTWRQMPGNGPVNKALDWFFWKRRMLNLRDAEAEARASQHFHQEGIE